MKKKTKQNKTKHKKTQNKANKQNKSRKTRTQMFWSERQIEKIVDDLAQGELERINIYGHCNISNEAYKLQNHAIFSLRLSSFFHHLIRFIRKL